ncbi:MAG TPA: AI-2E family transporter [Trebonia sp.]|jgi:predicted PurR-regulated permease PerM|nr:AI-2E family transporter [Trebonia sp.]
MSERGSSKGESPLRYRMRRLWRGADIRSVPLRTIIVAVIVVGAAYLGANLVYRLRNVLLLFLVAGFIALLLNPITTIMQRAGVRRRGMAVTLVTILALLVFGGLLAAFGYPLVNAITALANKLPSYVASAQSGKGWIGHLVTKYHVQHWVQTNAPKIATFAQDLSKPALSIGKGAASLLVELATIFVLVLLLLIEGPKLRRGILVVLGQEEGAEITKLAGEVNRAVTGYMLGNFLTSIIAGFVTFIPLLVLDVPYPFLWALWVALVDFLPMIGGALAGIPTILFAFTQGLTAGIATLVVFLVYTQVENHILNPIIMSKTVRISPLLVLVSVLVGAEIGNWVGGLFGAFVAALLSIPLAGAFQVVVREAWILSGPPSEGGVPPASSEEQLTDAIADTLPAAEQDELTDSVDEDGDEGEAGGGHRAGGAPVSARHCE